MKKNNSQQYPQNGTQVDFSWLEHHILSSFPIGAVAPWIGGYFTDTINGGFTNVLGNTVANVNAYLLASYAGRFKVCNGASLIDVQSPIFNVAGRFLPNISDSRFLMGSTTVGIPNTTLTGSTTFREHIHSQSTPLLGTNSAQTVSRQQTGGFFSTATIVTATPHGLTAGSGHYVYVTGVGGAGYNGTFTVSTTPTPTSFTYSIAFGTLEGLTPDTGGSVVIGLYSTHSHKYITTTGYAAAHSHIMRLEDDSDDTGVSNGMILQGYQMGESGNANADTVMLGDTSQHGSPHYMRLTTANYTGTVDLSHIHSSAALSGYIYTSVIGDPSITAINKNPKFLSCFYIVRVK